MPSEALRVHKRDPCAFSGTLRNLPGCWLGSTKIETELHKAMICPGKDLIFGAHGVGEGIPPS